jgi:YVTN family beta-propeller protein
VYRKLMTLAACAAGSLIVATACGGAASGAGAAPRVVAKIPVGGVGPCGSVAAFGRIWVANYATSVIVRVDPKRNRLKGRPVRVGSLPCGINAGAGAIWIDGYGTNSIERLDPKTLKVKHIRVGGAPFDVAFGEGSVWSSNYSDGTVSRIDARTGKVVATIETGGKPTGLSVTPGAVWVGSQEGFPAGPGDIYRIDTATNAVSTVHVGHPTPGWFAATSTDLWISNQSDNTVSRLDLATQKVVATIPVGANPVDGGVAPDGSIWIPMKNGGTIWRIDPATNTVTAKLKVGRQPFVASPGFGDMWVGSFGGTDIRRIRTG